MAKKTFVYRGKTLEQLQQLDMKAFVSLLPSRVRRTILRGFTDQQKILLRNLEARDNVKTHCRDMPVLPMMIGKTILLYNGKEYLAVRVIPEMLGHVLGEYALTRKKVAHSAPGVGATRSSAAMSVR